MSQTSIFDLLQTSDTPQAQELQRWIASTFPKANDCASFLLAIQLEKLFEMAIYENQINTVHLLLQQGISPNMRADWGTTPLMWAYCFGYTQIAQLLISYGADQHLKSFYGKDASSFQKKFDKNSPEYKAIIGRKEAIHEQVLAGYLKPLTASDGTSSNSIPKVSNKKQRQIDNGKGIDEIFKKMKSSRKRFTHTISFVIS